MTNLNIRIGFSTVTNSVVSRFVRWITKSKCSHAFFVYHDEDWDVDMVLEASDVGFREIPLSVFEKANTIVALIPPKVNIEEGLKYVALTYLGTTFDYTGLLGNGPVLLGRWLKRKWHNPWNKPSSAFCSESIVEAMQCVMYPFYPGAIDLIPAGYLAARLAYFHGEAMSREEIEQLKHTIAILEADCEDGTCRACVRCHDAREQERDEWKAMASQMERANLANLKALEKAEAERDEWKAAFIDEHKAQTKAIQMLVQAQVERDVAVSAAQVQNKACAEEMLARQHMQAGWDNMVAQVKRHYEAQLHAEARERVARQALLLQSLIKKTL